MTQKFVKRHLSATLAMLALGGCGQDDSSNPVSHQVERAVGQATRPGDEHVHEEEGVVARTMLGKRVAHAGAHVTLGRPVQQLGLWITGVPTKEFAVRTRGLDGVWSDWMPVEVTWQEGELAVGRVFLLMPAMEVEYRGHQELEEVHVEYHERIVADPLVLARDLPLEISLPGGQTEDGLRVVRQGIAPRELVIPRAEWGARNPGKSCGSFVAPYRASVHHTALPASDGPDPAATMRQMQAYHIDTNKWCDIGYHFVVSQSGRIYQGRSNETYVAAHVGGQNSGNIGVSFIGNYQASTPPKAQIAAGQRILGWIHDTYPKIPWNRQSVRGHREWPGQSTTCPGSNLLALIPELMKAGDAPAPSADVAISVSWSPMPMNLNASGSSAMVPDLFPGDTLQAEILLTNRNAGPLRGVKLKTLIEEPYLRATSYTIYTDAPGFDQKTWMVNDANDAPGNPAKGALGKTATLDLYAMGAGETKRVLIDLEATEYSFGAIDHPDVRAWVRQIDGVYGTQDEWGQMPALNTTGGLLQAFTHLDVLARDQWQFDGGQAEDFEGWRSCGTESTEQIKINADGALALNTTNEKGCIESPPWTAVDASTWDMMVLRPRAHDGPHTMVLEWAREGEDYTGENKVGFVLPGDGTFRPVVLDMSKIEGWEGMVSKLRLWPRANANVESQEPKNWYDLDALFFQRSDTSTTNSTREDFVPSEPVVFLDPKALPVTPGPRGGEPGNTNTPQPGGTNSPGGTSANSSTSDSNQNLQVDDGGCSQAGGNSRGGAALGLLLLGLLGVRRRR